MCCAICSLVTSIFSFSAICAAMNLNLTDSLAVLAALVKISSFFSSRMLAGRRASGSRRRCRKRSRGFLHRRRKGGSSKSTAEISFWTISRAGGAIGLAFLFLLHVFANALSSARPGPSWRLPARNASSITGAFLTLISFRARPRTGLSCPRARSCGKSAGNSTFRRCGSRPCSCLRSCSANFGRKPSAFIQSQKLGFYRQVLRLGHQRRAAAAPSSLPV